jgi:hypothetical protein
MFKAFAIGNLTKDRSTADYAIWEMTVFGRKITLMSKTNFAAGFSAGDRVRAEGQPRFGREYQGEHPLMLGDPAIDRSTAADDDLSVRLDGTIVQIEKPGGGILKAKLQVNARRMDSRNNWYDFTTVFAAAGDMAGSDMLRLHREGAGTLHLKGLLDFEPEFEAGEPCIYVQVMEASADSGDFWSRPVRDLTRRIRGTGGGDAGSGRQSTKSSSAGEMLNDEIPF